MGSFRNLILLLIATFIASSRPAQRSSRPDQAKPSVCEGEDTLQVREALLATRYKSLEELKTVIRIEYVDEAHPLWGNEPAVRLTHCSNGRVVTSILGSGVDEDDFRHARDGEFSDLLYLVFHSPYALIHKSDILRIYYLGRRRPRFFGKGDVAFYDLAETSVCNIMEEDLAAMPPADTTEKGYVNTFNHVTAQALMTSCFSEELADFIADVHERHNIPELITGKFTEKQLTDPTNNPIENYVDIINNEWGQELGLALRKKYHIDRDTEWTSELLADYLNDIQGFYSWAFQIDFIPYKATDELVIRFSDKINRVMKEVPDFRKERS